MKRLSRSRVVALRDERRWTQVDLAREAGLHPSSIAKWENGHAEPSLANLAKLASVLGTSIEDLLEDKPANSEVAS